MLQLWESDENIQMHDGMRIYGWIYENKKHKTNNGCKKMYRLKRFFYKFLISLFWLFG